MLPGLRVSAEAQIANAGIDQGHRLAAPVACLPAVPEHRQVMPQARRLVALLGRTQRHGIGKPALRHQRPKRRGPGEAGLGDGEPRGWVALEGKRLSEPLHRAQRDVLGPRTLRQLQRTAGFAFRARPFAHAVRDVAAAPGRLGPPRITLSARRQGFGERQHGLDVLQLEIASGEQLQRALARGQQSPAQRAVVRRRQHQRPRRAV